ncbi:PfkB family carbohydrate kinase [Acidicapsa dinghuensis]|uniref:PfkB family carbohydrate kinase n=1 Tax=Acidicapsa dinghuensis TaxID=2218256 RepID=A0ABW1EFC3_9BACT|nr:PfkB family carbohydrate kinase [Acidicapsa dinghuensis]
MKTVLGLGELLWDVLPEGLQLGGAPANYTVMAGRLGNHAVLLSRIGADSMSERALQVLLPMPVDCTLLQTDPEQPTGWVTVELREGQPSYTIHEPVAWDFMELSGAWTAATAQADAICFGSLGQRDPVSRATTQALVRSTRPECHRIFDVNLRAPFYSAELIRSSLELATVMKMNDVEVPPVAELLGLPKPASLRAGAEALLREFPNLRLIAITRGGSGSLLVSPEEFDSHPGIGTIVADTIGAGDAFTAALTHYLLRGAPLRVLNEAGNRWGSFIASRSGAMPEISDETIARIAREIEG